MICMEYESTQPMRRGSDSSAKEHEDPIQNGNALYVNSRSITNSRVEASSRTILEGNMLENDTLGSSDNYSYASPKPESGRSLSKVTLHNFLMTFVVGPAFLAVTTGVFRSYTLFWGAVATQFTALISSYKNITLGDVAEQAEYIYRKFHGERWYEPATNTSDNTKSAVESKVEHGVDGGPGMKNRESSSKDPESTGEDGGIAIHMHGHEGTYPGCSEDIFVDDALVYSKSDELLCAMASFDPSTSFTTDVCSVFCDAYPATIVANCEM